MKISGIYQIQSKVMPERIYIGSAVNIYHRWKLHINGLTKNKHDNKKLQNHYNKYGYDDLHFSILLKCPKDFLIVNEQFYIDSYKPYFNILKIAGSSLGYKHTKEARLKVSLSQIGGHRNLGKHRIFSDEHHRNLSISRIGNKNALGSKRTKERLLQMSENFKGENNPNYGKLLSKSHRANISKSKKNKPWTQARRLAQKNKIA